MITDQLLGLLHDLFAGFLGIFPAMSTFTTSDATNPLHAFQMLWRIGGYVNVLVPVAEILAFMPMMLIVFALLGAWRLVRLFLPGGGG